MSASIGKRNAAATPTLLLRAPWQTWRTRSLAGRAIRFIETYCVAAKGHRAGEPIKLARYQRRFIEQAVADGVDVALLTLPRGNGKSTFTGALGTWALFDHKVAEHYGGVPDIPVIAPTLKQARKGVYGAAVAFRKNSPDLAGRSTQYTATGEERIHVHDTGGELYPAAGDPDTLQGLDPSVAFVDELGFISLGAYDALLLAAGKRPRNLIVGLGTRNPDDVENALDHLLERAAEGGERADDEPVVVVQDYSADPGCDLDDRRQWKQANPAMVDGFLRESAIVTARRFSPAPSFATFRLNLKTGSQAGWLGVHGPEWWDTSEVERVEFGEVEPVLVGVDKSAYDDCSAVVALQRLGGERWHCTARVWLPDPTIDHRGIRDYLRALCERHNVIGIGFDDRYFVEGATELADEGLPLIKVPQTPARLVPAYSALFRSIKGGDLLHEHDPTFRRHVLGAVPRFDTSGGFTLAKSRSKAKIDAAVALGIARAVDDEEIPTEPDYSDVRSFEVR